jgi:hypothetical protein
MARPPPTTDLPDTANGSRIAVGGRVLRRREMPSGVEPTIRCDEESLAELDPQARLRFEHRGRWVAWSPGFDCILAHGDDRETVKAEARAAGMDRPILEWIPVSLAKSAGSGA